MYREWLVTILTLGLVFQQLVWLLTDTRSRKERVEYYFRPQGFLTGLYGGLFMFLNLWSGLYFPMTGSNFSEIGTVLGWALYLGGIILAIWAKLTMKKSWGVPGQHKKERQDKLIISVRLNTPEIQFI